MNNEPILYVDDEPINLMLFTTIFRKQYKVLTAESGRRGLELLSENPQIKLVFSDLKMPEMDGIEFLTLVKSKLPDTKCFIITGYDMKTEISDAIHRGIVHKYFNKPYKVKEIQQAISEFSGT